MQNHVLEQYKNLYGRIRAAEQDDLSAMIFSLSGVFDTQENGDVPQNKPVEKAERMDRHEYNQMMTALLALMVHYGLELYHQGLPEYRKKLPEDLSELAKTIRAWQWHLDSENTSEMFFDIVMCLSPEEEPLLRLLCPEELPQDSPEKVSTATYSAVMSLGQYCLEQSMEEESVRFYQGLARLSRKRSRFDVNWHRSLVVYLTNDIVQKLPECAVKICSEESAFFDTIEDTFTGEYFWAYGNACLSTEQFSKGVYAFQRCWEIRCKDSGPDDWYTQAARVDMVLAELGMHEYNDESLHILQSYIEKAESGFFEANDRDYVLFFEGMALWSLLNAHQTLFCLSGDYELLCLYHRLCGRYNSSIIHKMLKLRYSCNLMSAYCLETGDYIQSEAWIQKAIDSPFPSGLEEGAIINRIQLKTGLLLLYDAQNDDDRFLPLLKELLNWIEDQDGKGLQRVDIYRVLGQLNSFYLRKQIEPDKEFFLSASEDLREAYEVLVKNRQADDDWYCVQYGMYLISSIMILVAFKYNICDYPLYYSVMRAIERDAGRFDFGSLQKALLYLAWGSIAVDQGKKQGTVLLQQGIRIAEKDGLEPQTYAALLRTAAFCAYQQGQRQTAGSLIHYALSKLTERWHYSVRYCNDARLTDALYHTYTMVLACYSIQRSTDNVRSAYETVLRFKSLASLAGRERNRIVRSSGMDSELLKELQTLQNRIAGMETNSLFREEPAGLENAKEKLRRLEAEFAKNFPHKAAFTEISSERVLKAMPDNCAVIEYYYGADLDFSLQYRGEVNQEEKDNTVLDVYLLSKRQGIPSISKMVLPDAQELLELAERYVDILQRESMRRAAETELEEKESMRADLYHRLLQPLLKNLTSFQTLYIAPDQSLINLPFEILGDKEDGRLGEHFSIIRMECARDFLFSPAETSSFGSCIIGNPDYGATDRLNEPTHEGDSRGFGIDPKEIYQLPFSKREAQIAARACGTSCLTGAQATKKALTFSFPPRNIHIATHGYCDLELESNALYSSCLLLAGAKTWLETGLESQRYGSGILTADEVSRMNLNGVELVVLSSCLSGMNSSQWNKGLQGLLGSFAAAGVGYVVTHLWSADDFATAVLMEAFYQAYGRRKLSPPEALHIAQRRLRTITLAELDRSGWLDYADSTDGVSYETRAMVKRWKVLIARGKGGLRPFAKEAYWGGFSCYQCRAF